MWIGSLELDWNLFDTSSNYDILFSVTTPSHLMFRSVARPATFERPTYDRGLDAPSYSPLAPQGRDPGVLAWWREMRDREKAQEIEHKKESRISPIVEKEVEASIVGALLGLSDAQFGGLDIQGKYPVDGIIALLALLSSLGLVSLSDDPHHWSRDVARHVGNVGTSTNAVFTYRKLKAWREGNKTSSETRKAVSAGVERSSDPIVATAKNL